MSEVETTPITKTAKSKQRKLVDVLVATVFIILCLVLAKNLLNQLNLKHEVSAATAVTDRVVNDLRNQDGKDVQSLGNKSFQSQNSAVNLTAQFKAASTFTASTPVIDRKTVTNDKTGQAVSIIYKFPKKPVFYVRVIVLKAKGSDNFQVANLKGSPTQKPLVDNKY